MFLGFGVYYVEFDKIKLINFDIISSDTCQDARAAVRGFRILRDQPFFKTIEKKEWTGWADCGKHFRNNELVGYLLLELPTSNIHGFVLLFYQKYFFSKFLFISFVT